MRKEEHRLPASGAEKSKTWGAQCWEMAEQRLWMWEGGYYKPRRRLVSYMMRSKRYREADAELWRTPRNILEHEGKMKGVLPGEAVRYSLVADES